MVGLITMLIYMVMFLSLVVIIFFFIRWKVQGKILTFLIDKDKTIKHFLFTPMGKLFRFKKDDEVYVINPDCVMLVRYPFGMPKLVQQVVPSLIYAKNNPQPLSPADISILPRGLTSKMVASSVSENVVKGIVQGVSEEARAASKLPSWFLPAITVFLVLILALMMYAMNAKVDAISEYIKVVK